MPHKLVARRNRPNRVLPIAGKPVHVHTGSTRLIDDADVPALQAALKLMGCARDYQLIPVLPVIRTAKAVVRAGLAVKAAVEAVVDLVDGDDKPKGKGKGKGK